MEREHDGARQTQPESAAGTLYQGMETCVRLILVALLIAMSILISYQVIARYVLNRPSSISEELLRYLLIWFGLLGSAYCFIGRKHLNLPLVLEFLSEKWTGLLTAFNAMISLIFGCLLTYGGYHAVVDNARTRSPMLGVSIGALSSVLAVAGVIIIISQLHDILALVKKDKKAVSNLAVSIAAIAIFIALWHWLRSTDIYEGWVNDHIELSSIVILFGAFFIFLVIGTPIALGLAFAGLFTLSLQIDFDVLFSTMGEKMFGSLDSFGFLALPFFILAGNIMNQAGIARRLIDFANLFGRRIPGSLWQTNVIANMLFGCLSGSGIAASTAIGGIMTPVQREQKYDMAFSTAVNASSAPTGMLIPPSGALIVYSLITGGSASIVGLFLAGYIPGLIMGVAVMIWAYVYAGRHNYPVDRLPLKQGEAWRTFISATPSLLLVVIVIGGIIGGVFTATEGAGVAVLYSIMLAAAYRKLTVKTIVDIFANTAIASGVIMFLISCSSLMSWSMTFASIPDTIGEFLTTVSSNKYTILLIINLTLLVVGVFMDMAPAQLIFTPILFPIVTELGVNPIHFGIIMTYNLSMGIVTPPVGTVLFVSCSLTEEKITTVSKKLLPIFALQIIGLLLVTYVPAFSLALPRLFGII